MVVTAHNPCVLVTKLQNDQGLPLQSHAQHSTDTSFRRGNGSKSGARVSEISGAGKLQWYH